MADMGVTVCVSPAERVVWCLDLRLPLGSTVQDALNAAMHHPQTETWPGPIHTSPQASAWAGWTPGIWKRKCSRDTVLRDGDRVELYRPLRVDPKVARRERFQKQGARTAGLFAARRPQTPPRKGPG